MDGSFARNMDLGKGFALILVFAAIGALACVASIGWFIYFVAQHVHWF